MVQLSPTAEDYQALIANNPLALEQLKAIVYARLLAERDEEVAALKAEMADRNVTDITSAAGDDD
jgi:ABC-type uncharacterized transport system permease subunit